MSIKAKETEILREHLQFKAVSFIIINDKT